MYDNFRIIDCIGFMFCVTVYSVLKRRSCVALLVERGKNVLFYSVLLYIDRKKIFRQPEPEFVRLICINRQEMLFIGQYH